MEADPQCLQPLKNAFKRLLQTHRSFKAAEQEVVDIWKPFANRRCRQEFESLRSQNHEAYAQASSLLKLTSQMSVDGDSDEVTKKREEVAQRLMEKQAGVMDMLDGSLEYGRCQPMYDHVVANVDKLLHKCETATLYLERLRKSLPVQQLCQMDIHQQVHVCVCVCVCVCVYTCLRKSLPVQQLCHLDLQQQVPSTPEWRQLHAHTRACMHMRTSSSSGGICSCRDVCVACAVLPSVCCPLAPARADRALTRARVWQEAVWAWCDLEEHVGEGACCFSIGNAGLTSDEYQLRSPPFYAVGVPWTLRLYKAKKSSGQVISVLSMFVSQMQVCVCVCELLLCITMHVEANKT